MLPLFIFVAFRRHRHSVRWWLPIPLFLIWLFLLPLVLVLLPFAALALLALRMSPLRTLAIFWNTLTSLRGSHLEVDDGDTQIMLSVL
jgi:hypothetical protein